MEKDHKEEVKEEEKYDRNKSKERGEEKEEKCEDEVQKVEEKDRKDGGSRAACYSQQVLVCDNLCLCFVQSNWCCVK